MRLNSKGEEGEEDHGHGASAFFPFLPKKKQYQTGGSSVKCARCCRAFLLLPYLFLKGVPVPKTNGKTHPFLPRTLRLRGGKKKIGGEEKILKKRHSPISEAMNSGAGPDSLSNQKTIVLTYKRAAYPAPTARLSGARGPGPGLYRVWGSRHSVPPLLKEGHTAVSPAVATETRGGRGGDHWPGWQRGQVSRVMSLPLERHTAGSRGNRCGLKTQPDAGGPFPPRSGNHNNQGE